MDSLFGSLKSFLKLSTNNIDNYIFRLHYRATVAVLIAFSILVTCRQYFGDPIDCVEKPLLSSEMLDTYCWIHSTFSVDSAWHKKVGEDVLYPGIEKKLQHSDLTYHAYYQWVCFVLFLQALLFYLPRYFWKAMEGGKVKSLILGLNSPIVPEDQKNSSRRLLVEYFACNFNNHGLYFVFYFLAEIMNFVNVVGQMFLMDKFLGGHFSTYGSKVLAFTEWSDNVRYDPMVRVFPRMTKCNFHIIGPSGTVETHDTLCILPINIINEKIYVFLWFWFIALAILTGFNLVYRALVVVFPKMRFMVLHSRVKFINNNDLEQVVNRCKMGDWMLLNFLSKNLDPLNFRDLVSELADRLGTAKMLD